MENLRLGRTGLVVSRVGFGGIPIQRLGEERFRQEWTTFKSDDQKRWVNYTLSQEEQTKESGRKFERLNDRTTTLEELLQDLQDAVQQSNKQIETLLNNLLPYTWFHRTAVVRFPQ